MLFLSVFGVFAPFLAWQPDANEVQETDGPYMCRIDDGLRKGSER